MQLNGRVLYIAAVALLVSWIGLYRPVLAQQSTAEETVPADTRAGRAFPTLAVGLGGYFLEPAEITNAASQSAIISARPMLAFRVEQKLARFLGGDGWVLEPHFGFILPQISRESMAKLTGFLNFDVGYLVTDRLVPTFGLGVIPSLSISSAANVDVGGEFVTPGGSAWSWLFSNNAGLAYWVDPSIRLDVGTSVVRLFDDESRRFRYFIEVAYAF